MSDIFRDFARDLFGGIIAPEVPETIPLRILGLAPPVPSRDVIQSAFRRRALEVHPDLQLAYDHPVVQEAADEALRDKPEIRELVWARDVLIEMVPSPATGNSGDARRSWLSVTPPREPRERKCWKCERLLQEREPRTWSGPRKGWCWRCVQADDAERRRARLRRRRAKRHCAAPGCDTVFTPSRSDGLYCSRRCRQAAYRARAVTAKNGNSAQPPLAVTLASTEAATP